MRKTLINFIELFLLFWKFRRQYFDYIFHKRRRLYKCLREHNCKRIKPTQLCEWKISYGSYYFKTMYNNKKAFVKVTASWTKDGYFNEVICNNHIKNNSDYLADRTPALLLNFIQDEFYVLVFECVDIIDDIKNDDIQNALREFIDEYTRIGLIHQDLKPTNLTIHNSKYCMIDYGYSLCPESNHIRLHGKNHIENITESAKLIIEDPDYYYDDAIVGGLKNIDRDAINFIVGKDDKYFIRLAGNIYEYYLEQLPGRAIRLLHKRVDADSNQNS